MYGIKSTCPTRQRGLHDVSLLLPSSLTSCPSLPMFQPTDHLALLAWTLLFPALSSFTGGFSQVPPQLSSLCGGRGLKNTVHIYKITDVFIKKLRHTVCPNILEFCLKIPNVLNISNVTTQGLFIVPLLTIMSRLLSAPVTFPLQPCLRQPLPFLVILHIHSCLRSFFLSFFFLNGRDYGSHLDFPTSAFKLALYQQVQQFPKFWPSLEGRGIGNMLIVTNM